MHVYDMKINHLVNPLGFKLEDILFSWKVKNAAGKRQKSARIRITTDVKQQELLFDTGFCENAESLGWQLPVELCARTRYFWSVSVRTDIGEEFTSDVAWFETGKREEPWKGKWVGSRTDNGVGVRHPIFEKEIIPAMEVQRARLYICGLGLYDAWYTEKSGRCQRIGEEYLTPYCNNYHDWIQYQTFDVTELMRGEGKLSVLLGNGWYKGRFGFLSGETGKGYYGDEWKLIAEIVLTYQDGSEERIGSDESWQVRKSNITFSNIYDGEIRDDTLPPLPATKAYLCAPPEGKLTERMSPAVKVQKYMKPSELLRTPAGEWVYDMGQEFAGLFRLRVKEPFGTKIHIQTGELLQEGNFYNENLRTAKSEYWYVSNGREICLEPHFTYYGYRYVKVEGIAAPRIDDLTGLVLCSDIKRTGFLETGHDLVNRFLSNVQWGLASNFIDVPTDCPQRDERMGWTADAQVFLPTALYLTDSYVFYQKYLYDLWTEQQGLDGAVPDVVPSFDVKETSSVWGDAACIMPWKLYLIYGDSSILKNQYNSMKAWVEYIRKIDGGDHGWRRVFHFGDWLALDGHIRNKPSLLGGTDEEFIASIYYAASVKLLANAAEVLGYKADMHKYNKLAETLFEEVKREYYSTSGRCCFRTQTAQLLTLNYHLSDNVELIKDQIKVLFQESGGKLQTGFTGTPLLCNVLSENGMDEIAYQLLLNEEYPGWLYEVKMGATTVWERWNSLDIEGKVTDKDMNSMNHYAYGSVAEWIFKHAAGLSFAEEVPGCRKVIFRPIFHPSLGHLDAVYESPSGKWESGWRYQEDSRVKVYLTVPFGCEAEVDLWHGKGSAKTLYTGHYCFEIEYDEERREYED